MYVHVYTYLILYPSLYTKDDMVNYKSSDTIRKFQNGWVRKVLVKEVNEIKIIIARMSYRGGRGYSPNLRFPHRYQIRIKVIWN